MATLDLAELKLLAGSHESREDGVCAMEAVAWMAGEPHSDTPACTCPVIAQLVRSWNDALTDADRDRLLLPLLPLLVGTRSTAAVEGQRAYMALDWLVREHTAAWLEVAKLSADADALRALAPVANLESARAAKGVVVAARERADAAWDAAGAAARAAARAAAWDAAWAAAGAAAWAAAGAAAWDAARDAAWAAAGAAAWDAARAAARDAARAAAGDAAWDAARDAAWDAARAAAWDAARAAAGDAARDAARDALRPTVECLQQSCVELIRRMCAVR